MKRQGIIIAVVAGVVPGIANADAVSVMPSTPTYAWTFDGNADARFGTVDGTTHNAAWSTDTPFPYDGNHSFNNATGRYVDFGTGLTGTDAMTVSVWVKGASSTANRYIAGEWWLGVNQRSWGINTHDNRFCAMLSRDGSFATGSRKSYESSSAIYNNTWRHLAFTYEGGGAGTLRMFLDGDELTGGDLHITADASVPALHASNSGIWLGATRDGSGGDAGRYFDGLTDELAIWHSALSPQEIRWLSQNSIDRIPEPGAAVLMFWAVLAALLISGRKGYRSEVRRR